MPDLVRMIGEPERTVQLRQAIVTAVGSDGSCSVKVGNSATAIGGVRRLSSAAVTAGEPVWVLQQGYDLFVIGSMAKGQYGTAQVSDGLELYHASATPYIDFHRGAYGVDTADYNMRLINQSAGELVLQGGRFTVDSTASSNITATGTGAGFEFRERDATGNGWVWYAISGIARLWRAGYGDRFSIDPTYPRISCGDAMAGTWSGGGGHAKFCQAGRGNAAEMAFLHRNDGAIWIGSANFIQFETDGRGARLYIDGNGCQLQSTLSLNFNVIRVRNWDDANHTIAYLAGNDVEGAEIAGYGGFQAWGRVPDARVRLQMGDGNFALFDNGQAWSMKAIPSAHDTKDDIHAHPDDALDKVMRLRPVRYKRRYRDNRAELQHEVKMWEEYSASNKLVGKRDEHRLAEEAVGHADVRFGPGGRLHPDNIRAELGFVAEEVEPVVPELIYPASGDTPMGIMYGQATALLVKALQELVARVDALEGSET